MALVLALVLLIALGLVIGVAGAVLSGRRACLQEDSFEVGAGVGRVFERSEAILTLLSARGRITRADPKGGQLEGRLATSLLSWGEKVSLELTALGPERTRVAVRSWCVLATTLVDYGKNAENLLRIRSALVGGVIPTTLQRDKADGAAGAAIEVASRPLSAGASPGGQARSPRSSRVARPRGAPRRDSARRPRGPLGGSLR